MRAHFVEAKKNKKINENINLLCEVKSWGCVRFIFRHLCILIPNIGLYLDEDFVAQCSALFVVTRLVLNVVSQALIVEIMYMRDIHEK